MSWSFWAGHGSVFCCIAQVILRLNRFWPLWKQWLLNVLHGPRTLGFSVFIFKIEIMVFVPFLLHKRVGRINEAIFISILGRKYNLSVMYWVQNWTRSSQQCKLLPQNKETQVHREHWQAEFCYQEFPIPKSADPPLAWTQGPWNSTLPWDLQIRDSVVTEADRLDREVSFPWAALTENRTLGDLRGIYTLTVLEAVGEIIVSAGWTPCWGSTWESVPCFCLRVWGSGESLMFLSLEMLLNLEYSLQDPPSLFRDHLFPTVSVFTWYSVSLSPLLARTPVILD